MKQPTREQIDILNEEQSCVVIARPGSGKTFTLSQKIAQILVGVPWYKGVIAISYTRKASNEISERTLKIVNDRKSSFFGTIDKFCLSEITIPFFRQRFGISKNSSIKVVSIDESNLSEEFKAHAFQQLNQTSQSLDMGFLVDRYHAGEVYLELSSKTAMYFLESSKAARDYIKARYTHIIIDEYQDSGHAQHSIFLFLKNLGLIAIAVGDIDQSIYEFAGKSAKYLFDLNTRSDFKKYSLTLNHRCHPSIASYAAKLLTPSINIPTGDELRVYWKYIDGSEANVGNWISVAIAQLKTKFQIGENSEIAILVRNNRTAQLVQSNLRGYRVQTYENTSLDEVQNKLAHFFVECLTHIFNKKLSISEIFDVFLEEDTHPAAIRRSLKNLIGLKRRLHNNQADLKDIQELLISAGKTCLPSEPDKEAIDALIEVLGNPNLLKNFYPVDKEAISLLTIHKSKGLEFDVIFHLDLYQTILPSYKACIEGDKNEQTQCINLHYVAITRAKKATILVGSSRRTNAKNNLIDAQVSEYIIQRPDLATLRKQL